MPIPWEPPADRRRLTTIDAHTAGEPLRIITGGFDDIPGETILARRAWAREHLDHLRRALMWEPRGHADMYGCLPLPPATPDGDFGVLFLHNEGFSTMCGHGIIAVVTAGIEAGFLTVRAEDPVLRIDTPAGRVTARAHLRDGDPRRVERVSFHNVPSFLFARDVEVDVPGIGAVPCDVGFGGAFYAYVDADALGVKLDPAHERELIDLGMRIKHAVMAAVPLVHPTGDADLNFLYGTILVASGGDDVHSRNVCIFAEGELDRSPTGTGVSGRAAVHHAKGELALGTPIVIESILGTRFTVEAVETVRVGEQPAVITEVTGTAYVTGRHEFLLDPEDPLRHGFLLSR